MIREKWYFKDQLMLDMVTKGKRVHRRNLKKRSIGCIKESTECGVITELSRIGDTSGEVVFTQIITE